MYRDLKGRVEKEVHIKINKLPRMLKMKGDLKVKISFGNAPLSKNEMEALITNHVKEYVLTNTWW